MALQPRYGTPRPPGLPLQPRPRVITQIPWPAGTTTTSGYASSASALGGGTGTWASPANADGAPDSTYATWTVP